MISCPHCNGAGRIHIEAYSPALADVLLHVTSTWQSTATINSAVDDRIKPTAFVNRLQALARLGLVESRLDPTNARRREWRRK